MYTCKCEDNFDVKLGVGQDHTGVLAARSEFL